MDLLKVNNLKMYYEITRGLVRAVDDVSFGVNQRDALGLAGESGCGKTSAALSIIRLMATNSRIVGGTIELNGEDILKLPEEELRRRIRWKQISVIFQGAMNALHPTYKIGDQIVEAIMKHEDNMEKKQALERAGKLLELVGLDASRIKRYPHELSGGMKQRAVTAMALACNPSVLIADEPTTALDVIVQAQVLSVMKELRTRLDVAMILISNDLSIIAETCNKAAIMYAGKIVEYGDTVAIFKEPLHPYTQKLIDAFPSVLGRKAELSSIHGFPPDLLNPPEGCRFHPRCEKAMEICRKVEPQLSEEGNIKRTVACHLYGD